MTVIEPQRTEADSTAITVRRAIASPESHACGSSVRAPYFLSSENIVGARQSFLSVRVYASRLYQLSFKRVDTTLA
jgi:hypothetical protein